MKIIALRHGFRFDSALYFTPLTATGLEQADNLVEILKDEKIDFIANIPYDENFTKAMTMGKTIVEFDSGNIKQILEDSWKKINLATNKTNNTN